MQKLKKELPQTKIFNIKFKIIIIFVLLLFVIGYVRMFNIASDESYIVLKKYKTLKINNIDTVIKSRDNKILAMPETARDLYLNTKYIDKNKIKLFLTIIENNTDLSFTTDERQRIYEEIKTKKRLSISKGLNKETISQIKRTYPLIKRIKFLKYFTTSAGKKYLYGPEFDKTTRSSRKYSLDNNLYQPYLGLVDSENKGLFGVEKYLNKYDKNEINILKKTRSGINLYSKKEVKSRKKLKKEPGKEIKLTLERDFQKRLQEIIVEKNKIYEAENILVSVVEVESGEIIGLSQLLNFDASDIKLGDELKMKDYYTNYRYEVGSVIKPITLAIALDEGLVKDLDEVIDTSNGYMYIGRKKITDEHPSKEMTAKEVIAQSSNVGISRIALRMNDGEFLKGLEKLWIFKNDNTLAIAGNNSQYYMREKVKKAINKNKLIQRATTSYGYGFMITPYNLQRMYNAIFNNGKIIDFKIVEGSGEGIQGDPVFKKETLSRIEESLISVVEDGTGKAAKLKGFKIYGKTGTSHIASSSGKYENKYHSTFIGAVEGKNGKKYNILVTVVKPKREYRFASKSAAPIFKKVVKELFYKNKIKIDLETEK